MLLDASHAVVVSNANDAAVLDLEKKKAIGTVRMNQGSSLYLHPTGKLMGVLTTSGTALLLRTDDFSTVAEFPRRPDERPTRRRRLRHLRCLPDLDQQVRVVKLADSSHARRLRPARQGRRHGSAESRLPAGGFPNRLRNQDGRALWIYICPRNCRHATGQRARCVRRRRWSARRQHSSRPCGTATPGDSLNPCPRDQLHRQARYEMVSLEGISRRFGHHAEQARMAVLTRPSPGGRGWCRRISRSPSACA